MWKILFKFRLEVKFVWMLIVNANVSWTWGDFIAIMVFLGCV